MAALALAAAPSVGQGPSRLDLGGDLVVGGEAERYLRVLQLAGLAPTQPWTIRPLSPLGEKGFVASGDHPWKDRWNADSSSGNPTWGFLRPAVKLVYNSSFPYQDNDGPAWAGRGLTTELQGGIAAHVWRFRLQLAPIVFLAQNQAFTLAPNGATGKGQYADARFPGYIDAPQRFGPNAYGRVDPGNSTLSLDLPGTIVGVSNAAQSWGPARDFPLVLSGNSGGFLHAFAATKSPLNLGIVGLHFRLIGGRLSASDYAPVPSVSVNRWASALVMTIVPHGVEGLELGAARFIEGQSLRGYPTVHQVARLFTGGFSGTGALNVASENQLGSAFFRWAFPRAGIEVYGEYYRDDFSLDFRRFLQYPDDYATYNFGLQRVLHASAGRIRTFGFEIVNGELSSSNRGERGDLATRTLSTPLPPYIHSDVTQGHTNHGLLLGSPEAYGGAGWRVSVDQFDTRGRTSLSLERSLRLDWLPGSTDAAQLQPDVLWALRAEAMRFAGDREYTLSIAPMIDLNRNLQPGHDVLNLRVAFSVRGFR